MQSLSCIPESAGYAKKNENIAGPSSCDSFFKLCFKSNPKLLQEGSPVTFLSIFNMLSYGP